MQKLNFQTIKLKWTIISPIHIWWGDVYGRLSYFVDGDKLLVVSENWLTLCAEKEKDLFSDIVNSIKEGNFLKLEKLKFKDIRVLEKWTLMSSMKPPWIRKIEF